MSKNQIIINQMPLLKGYSNSVAFGKARNDINRIAEKNGILVKNVICKFYKLPFMTTINVLRQYARLISNIGSGNDIVVQYPESCPKAFPWAIKMLHNSHNNVTLFIHDIDSFRYNGDISKEVEALNRVDSLIVHTEAMAALLKRNGVRVPMHTLRLFDYLTDDAFVSEDKILSHRKEVIFAGFLKKSEFLPSLCSHDFGDISFNLYGIKDKNVDYNKFDGKKYCGVFDSEHTGQLVGGWGLVWDGKSIDTCAGGLGEYLRYNLSHKLSLYFAAGIPVIVWKQSSVAKLVESEKCGIAVESLKEIPSLLDNLTNAEYLQLMLNSRKIGTKLRNGEMTMAALRQL